MAGTAGAWQQTGKHGSSTGPMIRQTWSRFGEVVIIHSYEISMYIPHLDSRSKFTKHLTDSQYHARRADAGV